MSEADAAVLSPFLLLQLIPASEIMEELPTKHCSMCLSSFFFVTTWLSHSQTGSFHLLFASGETLQGFFVKGQRGALSHLHHLLPIMQNREALAAVHSKKNLQTKLGFLLWLHDSFLAL